MMMRVQTPTHSPLLQVTLQLGNMNFACTNKTFIVIYKVCIRLTKELFVLLEPKINKLIEQFSSESYSTCYMLYVSGDSGVEHLVCPELLPALLVQDHAEEETAEDGPSPEGELSNS